MKIKAIFKRVNMWYTNRKIWRVSLRNVLNKKRYYVIRRREPGAGFFSNYLYVGFHILYAIDKGWIPVVDMQNYTTLYNEAIDINGINNSWEYYYLQPCNISLEEAYESKNYILSDYNYHKEYDPYIGTPNSFKLLKDKCNTFREIQNKYIRYNSKIESEIGELYQNTMSGYSVLGVHIRGTDRKHKNKNHFITPEIQNYLDSIQDLMSSYPIDRIFLSTDEKYIITLFYERFGDLLIFNPSYRSESGEIGIHFQEDANQRKLHHYRLGLEVIRDMEMLSRCSYLVFSHSNVTTVAILSNKNGYKEMRFVPGK